MKRKDMNRKDKTAQMIGQVIRPVDEHTTSCASAPAKEPVVDDVKPHQGSYPRKLLQTTLSQELGLNLSMPMVGQGADVSMDFVADISTDFSGSWGAVSSELDAAQRLQSTEFVSTELHNSQQLLTNNIVTELDSAATADGSEGPRYRITKLLSQEVGKRTFLATEEVSQSQVVVKLLLFCPDMAEEEASLAQQDSLPSYELPAHLPYLESFEASTPLGDGLVLIKSYAEDPESLQQLVRHSAVATGASSGDCTRRHSDSPQNKQPSQKAAAAVPTVHPQFAYGAMRISAMPEKLLVQFPESYVHSGLIASEDNSQTPTEAVEMWLLIFLGLVIFVGGVVAVTGSILSGIVVAALLPVLYRVLVGPPKRRARIAKLRVTSETDGRAFISLTSMRLPIRDRYGRVNSGPSESKLHGSRLSIKTVKVSPKLMLSPDLNPIKAQLSFTFHNQNWHSKNLNIVGSYAEIRWLSHHLAEWGRSRRTS
ncbi:MAG: hypothetical protein AAF528_12400 [Cyanobacteria bacterium P01_C01_bin.121]